MFSPFAERKQFPPGSRVSSVLCCVGYLPIAWTPGAMILEQINTKSVLTGMHVSLEFRALEGGVDWGVKDFAWLRAAVADRVHCSSC